MEEVDACVHPEDRAARRQAIDHAVRAGADLEMEYRTLRPDGQVAWILARGRAAYDEGRAIRIAGVSLDITERKAGEQRQRLLLDELNHRVKNTLATVQSIAVQTRKFVSDPFAFDEAFLMRLEALARAHDLLTERSWEGASLEDVLRRTLAPYAASDDGRVTLLGPRIRLSPNAAVSLNMAFHELATNAVKFGALSTSDGRIEVHWRASREGDGEVVGIDWREAGGPEVIVPVRRGFGSRLIEHGLARELEGEAQLVFGPKGLHCRMRFPVSSKLGLAA